MYHVGNFCEAISCLFLRMDSNTFYFYDSGSYLKGFYDDMQYIYNRSYSEKKRAIGKYENTIVSSAT